MTIFIERETKHTFYQRRSTFFAKSPPLPSNKHYPIYIYITTHNTQHNTTKNNKKQPKTTKNNQKQPKTIKKQSKIIKNNQKQSKTIKNNQKQPKTTRLFDSRVPSSVYPPNCPCLRRDLLRWTLAVSAELNATAAPRGGGDSDDCARVAT